MVRSIPFGSGTNYIKSSKPKVQLPATLNFLTTHQNIKMERVIENGTLPNYRYPANPNNLPLCSSYLNAGTYTYTDHNLTLCNESKPITQVVIWGQGIVIQKGKNTITSGLRNGEKCFIFLKKEYKLENNKTANQFKRNR